MKNVYLCLLATASIFTSACNRYYYKPNAVNTPLFTDKGQLHLCAAGSSGEQGLGKTSFFDAQGAYSPVKHLGIIANYSTYNFKPHTDYTGNEANVPAKAYLAEAGIGAYYPIGDGRFKMVVDAYVGGGVGELKSDVDLKARRLFLQPGIGVTSPIFDAGFNLRLVNLSFSDLDDNGRGAAYLQQQNLVLPGHRIDEGSYTFLEPSFTVRVGYKFAKAQFQTVFINPVANTYWQRNDVRFTVGFHFALEGLIDVIQNGPDEVPSLPEPPRRRSFRD